MGKKDLIGYLNREGFVKHIIDAFIKVDRKNFVPEKYKKYAYQDYPIPIGGKGATTSQPYVIAFMLDKLDLKPNKKQKVLEIGSGSGFVLALISEITKGNVFGIEMIKQLAENSKKSLKNYKNITIINKNGFNGLPEHAPYDRILVSASSPSLVHTRKLSNQLKKDGIIVASVKDSIIIIKKKDGKISEIIEHYGFVFVPLLD